MAELKTRILASIRVTRGESD